MRLDLFLKLSRLVKRRAVARELCDNGRVMINGHEAKPAKEVKPGDLIIMKFSTRIIELEVLQVAPAHSKKTLSGEPYRITSDKRTPLTETEWNINR